MTDPAPPLTVTRPGRREYVMALVVLAFGSGVLLAAAGQPWGTATVSVPGLPALTITATGREVAAEVAACGVLGLAGLGGLAATRRVGRILVGLVLVIAGAVAAFASWSFHSGAVGSLTALLSERAGAPVDAGTTTTSWWIVAFAGALLVLGVGVAAVVRSRAWPAMGSRYERAAPDPGRATTSDAAGTWAALDRGEDPTL